MPLVGPSGAPRVLGRAGERAGGWGAARCETKRVEGTLGGPGGRAGGWRAGRYPSLARGKHTNPDGTCVFSVAGGRAGGARGPAVSGRGAGGRAGRWRAGRSPDGPWAGEGEVHNFRRDFCAQRRGWASRAGGAPGPLEARLLGWPSREQPSRERPSREQAGGGWASGQAAGGQVHPRALRLARGKRTNPDWICVLNVAGTRTGGAGGGAREDSLRGPAVSDPQPRAVQPSAGGGRVGERPGGGQAGAPRGHLGWRGTSIPIPTGFVCSTSRVGEWAGRRGSSSTPAVSGTAHQPQNLGGWCGSPPTPTGP